MKDKQHPTIGRQAKLPNETAGSSRQAVAETKQGGIQRTDLRKPGAIWTAHVFLLSALCALLFALSAPSAQAQGSVKIPIVVTVPATCSVSGTNSPVMVWKRSGTNPGLYICIAGVFQYQTNTFGASLTAKTMLYASATPATVTSTAAPTNGQLLIGSTGNIPALGTLTGTANETLITNAAGSITIGLATTIQHKAGANFLLTDTTDTAKKFQFIASGITTANTRSLTLPDSDTTLPIASQVLTFSGPTAARTVTLFDANFTAARRNDFNAHTNVAAPATPAAGITNTWADATDKNFQAKDDAGVITVTVKPDTGASNNFLTAISSAGVITKAQPAFSNLSGAATAAQVYTVATSQLSTTPAVDMNTGTATTLLTCPTGKSCVVTSVVVRNASTSLTTASYSFGWTSAAFADVIANATHTELTGATLYTKIDAKVGATLGTSTQTFKVLMNTLQGGAATTTMDVFGYVF